MTQDELLDKYKSDFFVRFVAITQILGPAIQVLVRWQRHLAVSQLEIAVVAFATSAVMVYALD
jgi:hypothetical protein